MLFFIHFPLQHHLFLPPLVLQGNYQCWFDSASKIICTFIWRTLLFGICSTISTNGPLQGMLGGRFILLFLTCLSFLIFRGFLFTLTIFCGFDFAYGPTDIFKVFLLMSVLLMPQLFLSLYSTIGFSRGSLKLIYQHPSLLLMSSGKKWFWTNTFHAFLYFSYLFHLCEKLNIVWKSRLENKIEQKIYILKLSRFNTSNTYFLQCF